MSKANHKPTKSRRSPPSPPKCPFAALSQSYAGLSAVWDRHIAPEVNAFPLDEAELYVSRLAVALARIYKGPISPDGGRFLLKCAAMVADCAEDNEERATLDAIRPALHLAAA